MKLIHITPHPLLNGCVEKMWILQVDGRAPSEDMKIIVPNGLIKMVIPFQNSLYGKMEGWSHVSKENTITLIGLTDIPSIVDYQSDSKAGTIGVEFSPMGAYRFFNLNFSEIRNQIHDLDTILGKTASILEERIANERSLESKVALLQQFLVAQLMQNHTDPIYDFCIQKILNSRGTISIKELERLTGYSSRWLHMKFQEKLGVSPKNLASITRFMQFYQSLAVNKEASFFQNDFYTFYYDQSHFIKEFKRFTGLPPTKFINGNNDFGKIFYKG